MQTLALKRKIPFLLSFLLVIISSCTSIRLISEYDEITDKAVTALQEKVSKFFVTMEGEVGTPQAGYDNYKAFYQDIKVDLRTLKIRADAIDKNQIVQSQVAELTKMTDNLEKIHQIGLSSVAQVKALEQPFNSAFTAIIKLQLGLKRGEKK